MKKFTYDLIVIGAGSAGVRASRMAARAGAKVAVVEAKAIGGTCVNIGCVPKKLFFYAAEFQAAWQDAKNYGWNSAPVDFDWHTLRDNKTKEIERLNGIYQRLLEQANVTILYGKAKVIGEHEVKVNEQIYTAERILIATGNLPYVPAIPGKELVSVSDDLFYLSEFPKDMIIVGGGYIACEFAGVFAHLGAKVTQLYRGEMILNHFDEDIRKFITLSMKEYVDFRPKTDIQQLDRHGDKIIAHLDTGEKIKTDLVLYATGRKPNTADLGLHELGVKCKENGAIIVNEQWQTSVPSIYAIGDVIDHLQLTPVALAEAMAFVKTVFEKKPTTVDYNLIPTAVFSEPTIATVGLTESQARKKYPHVKIFKSQFKPLKHTLTKRNVNTFIKLIVDKETDKVLGVHMVGEHAAEIVQGFAVALTAGATKAMFDATIGIHPTTAEEFVTLREPIN